MKKYLEDIIGVIFFILFTILLFMELIASPSNRSGTERSGNTMDHIYQQIKEESMIF